MKRSIGTFCLIGFSILLAGCRIDLQYSAPEADEAVIDEPEEEKEEEIQFVTVEEQLEAISVGDELNEDGEINTSVDIAGMVEGGMQLKLKGKSNLPEGAVLTILLQEYGKQSGFSVNNILQGEEPEGDIIAERDIVIGASGEFKTTVTRKDKLKYSKMTVTFRPERQPEELQLIYGPHGENITLPDKSRSRITYTVNNEEYTGYQAYAPIEFLNAFSQLWEEYQSAEEQGSE
ncbi:hypothetical protein [Bacillus sp. AK031]